MRMLRVDDEEEANKPDPEQQTHIAISSSLVEHPETTALKPQSINYEVICLQTTGGGECLAGRYSLLKNLNQGQ